VTDWLITVPLGAVLGFLIGLTGVGGGALVAPSLYVILGLKYQDSIALLLVYSLFTKIVDGIQHVRQGTVLWKITLVYGLAGIPGSILGSHAIYWVGPATERIFPYVMAALLATVAVLILLETVLRRLAAREKPFSPQRADAVGHRGHRDLPALRGHPARHHVGGQRQPRDPLDALPVPHDDPADRRLKPRHRAHDGDPGRAHALRTRRRERLAARAADAGLADRHRAGAKTALRLPGWALKLVIVVLILAGAVATVAKAGQIAR
jgi:uncharacterized membrane protein YfcA